MLTIVICLEDRERANLKIQMVNSVCGLAYYVFSYVAKKKEPDELKDALGKMFARILEQPPSYSFKRQLYMIGKCVLKSRRLSAQEAAARTGHLQLVWPSRTVVYLNTRPPSERFRLLRPKHERDTLYSDSTDNFCHNFIDYYKDCPKLLENKCLMYFASRYKLSASSEKQLGPRSQQRLRLRTTNKVIQGE